MTELEEQYARAVELYQAGKLEEAKAVFHAVAAAGAREHLTLAYETEAGLRRYVGRIDDDIAEAERERQAALVAEEAARKAAAEEEARRATAEAEARDAAARVEAEAAAKTGAEEKLAEAARKQQIAAEKAHREAAALYQQAMELIRQDQRDAALLKLEQAVGIDPTLADAQQALSDLRKEMGLISPEERLFAEEVRIETVRHGRAAREMDQSLIQAQELIDEHKYDEALAVLRRVATKAEVGDYPASMKREYAKRANGLIAKADKEKAGYEAALEDRRRKEAETKAEEAARYQRELRARQIKELFRQAEDMYMSQRFGEADSAVKAILSLDPDNGEAKVMLDQVDRGRSRLLFLELSEQRAREYREHWEATQEATRIRGERETIVYPDDWKEMSRRREEMLATLAPEVSAAEAAVRDKLQRQVTFSFADTPLVDVADFLRRVGDVNIVVDQRVLAAAGPGG
ncbi:MAG: hypothetical protein KAX80_07380, partial [Planctomycetes bacterium]|nr:hypothetical protein [Planctomycetota bacterium]